MGGRGTVSSIWRGNVLEQARKKALTATGDNPVVSFDESKAGKIFHYLGIRDRSTIGYMVSLNKKDFETLEQGYFKITRTIKIGGKNYKTIIDLEDNKFLFSLKQGNKYIVKNGTQVSVANQLAHAVYRSIKV